MGTSIQAIRGMNDILPAETFWWQYIEHTLKKVLRSYHYQEIRFPIIEKTTLFKRSIGEETDIVEKEMYTFVDRNEDSLTLRPEGTAPCVRAGIEHGILYHQIQRLWYLGPFFRHERPQKGRYRQFHQCGAEIFGIATPDSDAELIKLSYDIFKSLNLLPHLVLQLNTLGTPESRNQYKKVLVDYLTKNIDLLDEDSQRRLKTNPLRILDSKNPALQNLIKKAPKLQDHLDEESCLHFEKLCSFLSALEIPFEINPCLVRGLDYYTKTVFEWTTQELGAQGTVCAGGRYDGLVGQLGGSPIAALGFAIGLERTVLLLQQKSPHLKAQPLYYYFITDSDETLKIAFKLASMIREMGFSIVVHCGEGNIKNQLKKADKSGALYALILGHEENKNNGILLKHLRENTPQEFILQEELMHRLSSLGK